MCTRFKCFKRKQLWGQVETGQNRSHPYLNMARKSFFLDVSMGNWCIESRLFQHVSLPGARHPSCDLTLFLLLRSWVFCRKNIRRWWNPHGLWRPNLALADILVFWGQNAMVVVGETAYIPHLLWVSVPSFLLVSVEIATFAILCPIPLGWNFNISEC